MSYASAVENDPAKLRALYGTALPPAVARGFTVGRLAFELLDGNLRSICFDGVEVIRGVQYLMRDRDWGTVAPALRDIVVKESREGISIDYIADCIGPDGGRLAYRASIRAREAGLEFTVEAKAIDAVTINRLGFCVLHPADLAGAVLRVAHGDGAVSDGHFPVLIEPWQPFTDIAALEHEQDGITVSCQIEGDACEMEDQRNWSDASFKTYTRPLALPWPYQVAAGTIDRQVVRLGFVGRATRAMANGPVEINIAEAVGVMPGIGLVLDAAEVEAFIGNRAAFDELGVQDLLLSGDDIPALALAVAGLPQRKTLECVIAASGDLDGEMAAIAHRVRRAGLELDGVAVYPAPDLQSTPPGSKWPDCPPASAILAAARRAFPGFKLGGGNYSYFTELNRKRPPPAWDFISHATCPIVHAADDLSVMQSLGAVPHILRSARAIIGDTPYRLGPVMIGMRQNPYGARTMPNPQRARLPMAMVDPRQDGAFAAAWTIGYAAATAGAGLDVLTLGSLTGPFGLIGSHGRRPLFAAVAALAAMVGAVRYRCLSSHPDQVQAIATDRGLILANLTPAPVVVRVEGVTRRLDPFGWLKADFGPFAP